MISDTPQPPQKRSWTIEQIKEEIQKRAPGQYSVRIVPADIIPYGRIIYIIRGELYKQEVFLY